MAERKIGMLSKEDLAAKLHLAGLHAFAGYKYMGYSQDLWEAFRLRIAEELLNDLEIRRKVDAGNYNSP